MEKRRYSIRQDQKDYRQLLLSSKVNKAKKMRELFFRHKDVQRLIKYMETTGIKQPYANNIAERFFMAATEINEAVK